MSEEPDGDAGTVAEVATLRRIERLAVALAVVLALLFASWRGWVAAFVLTAGAAVSIVGFRGLEGVVRQLRAGSEGEVEQGGHRLGWRAVLLVAALASLFFLAPDHTLAACAGVSAIPLALMAEAGRQLLASASLDQR